MKARTAQSCAPHGLEGFSGSENLNADQTQARNADRDGLVGKL